MQHWLEKYGFAFLVFVALACAGHLAGSAEIPRPVPDWALQAPEVYRLEIGAAFFVAFYLATMAVLLALRGRGFAELGTQGVKIDEVIGQTAREQHAGLSRQLEVEHRMERRLSDAHAEVKDLWARVESHQQRLEKLEAER